MDFIRSSYRRELISNAVRWSQEGKSVALVTLVNVEGSSPYPIGCQMLVSDTGEYLGQITGGCAERSIADQARDALVKGENSIRRYGLNSPYFDIQLPCGSGIDVHIDVSRSLEHFSSVQHQLESRRVVDERIDAPTGTLIKRYLPNQRLLLLGQGPILTASAKIGLEAGFDILCVAQNQASGEHLSAAGLPFLVSDQCPDIEPLCDEFTGVVSLFHEHEFEQKILFQALNSRAFYVGALGSRRTHRQRLEKLAMAGVKEDCLNRICGPVGINISAKTPNQIAVAIIAQAIDRLNLIDDN